MTDNNGGFKRLWSVDRDAKRVGVAMLAALLAGGGFVGFALTGTPAILSGLLWAAACSAVGWFLGFLFGIPRSLSTDTARTVATTDADPATAPAPAPAPAPADGAQAAAPAAAPAAKPAMVMAVAGPSTAVNTNLEQISDWLTKIIVGVTLVESDKVFERMDRAAKLMAGSMGGDGQLSFAYAVLVYFSVTGLLGSYLLTRLFLQSAFTNAAAGRQVQP